MDFVARLLLANTLLIKVIRIKNSEITVLIFHVRTIVFSSFCLDEIKLYILKYQSLFLVN